MPFPTYDTIDAIPEDQRDVYEEGQDKKWRAKVPDVTNLNTALETERTKAAEEKKGADQSGERGDRAEKKGDGERHLRGGLQKAPRRVR